MASEQRTRPLVSTLAQRSTRKSPTLSTGKSRRRRARAGAGTPPAAVTVDEGDQVRGCSQLLCCYFLKPCKLTGDLTSWITDFLYLTCFPVGTQFHSCINEPFVPFAH